MLREKEPALAERSLRTAEEDWGYAIVGVDGPETWHTPAFAATRVELAGTGITASLELYRATQQRKYADKAAELARVIVASQQTTPVGGAFPLNGFFYTGPERDTLFHQFHRGNDQAAIVALAQLVELLPDHPDWVGWYATVVRYAEYQKRAAETTAPYGMLPAYVYRAADAAKEVPDSGALHLATREAYRAQVESGMPMGDGWYLRAFPVWFARRGNLGILLAQAKALSAASRLRGDSAGLDLAERQAEWVVGRNPFAASMMYGEGYDWSQQYSVSSGDFVGSLPVGMQSRGVSDLPYWPQQNMYVYKEVWVHPSARWLWLMEDLLAGTQSRASLGSSAPLRGDSGWSATATEKGGGALVLRLTVSPGARVNRVTLRADGLVVEHPTRVLGTARAGRKGVRVVEWRVRRVKPGVTWVAVLVPDGDVARRREVVGALVR
jgi:hypothetical protein